MTEGNEPMGAGVLEGLAARVLRFWQEYEGRRVQGLRRCGCCDELMGRPLADSHWPAMTRRAKAWHAEVERSRGRVAGPVVLALLVAHR